MASVTFQRVTGSGLFLATVGADSVPAVAGATAPTAGYLPQAELAGQDQVTLEQTWQEPAWEGVYLLLEQVPTDAAAFVSAVRSALESQGEAVRFAWVTGVDSGKPDVACIQLIQDPGTHVGQVTAPARLGWTNQVFLLGKGLTVDLEAAAGRFTLEAAGPGTSELIDTHADAQWRLPAGTSVHLRLEGEPGVFSLESHIDWLTLESFGGDVRYFTKGGPQGLVQRRYPVFRSEIAWGEPAVGVTFDPLGTTSAGSRTRFGVPVPSGQPWLASNLLTTAGASLEVSPLEGAGFVTARIPAEGDPTVETLYLTPHGPFEVRVSPSAAEAPAAWMPGLSASEFVPFDPGARLEFTGPGAACARYEPQPEDGPDAGLLDAAGTTAWLNLGSASPGDARYFCQPGRAAYFGAQSVEESFLDLVPVEVGDLSDAIAGIPAAPYGGALRVQGQADAQDLSAFEELVLARARAAQVPMLPSGPLFGEPGSIRTRASTKGTRTLSALRTEADEPACLTKQGFLALLNEDGSWKALQFARSPTVPEQVLQLPGDGEEGSRRISAVFAEATLNDPLFLVVTRRDALGTFDSKLTIDGFTPDLEPAARGEALGSVLIFKYHAQPLVELVQDPGTWSSLDAFTEKEDVAAVQEIIAKALASTDPAFDHFKEVVRDPSWNGMLSLNCALGAEGLPAELVGLLGGMGQALKFHHVGIEMNQVSVTPARLDETSLFGLVRYPDGDPPIPVGGVYDYSVELMLVVFRNSALLDFQATIELTAHELFGRPVRLEGAEGNTITIEGSYQEQGGSTLFQFIAVGPARFRFPIEPEETRVLGSFEARRVAFTTVSHVGQAVTARFALAGDLVFNPEGWPFDAFGFVSPEAPLPVRDLRIAVAFRLAPEDGKVHDRTLVFDPSALEIDVADARPAVGSLPGSFPLTLTAFKASTSGLSAGKLGGQLVQTRELVEADLQTPSPHYALDFLLPLGTLGSLSSVHISFDAHLIVGWGPHPTIPARDAIGIAVQMPGAVPGFRGFDLQGILKLSFGTANLARFEVTESIARANAGAQAYFLGFNDIGLRLFSFKLPPGYIIDALLFAGEGDPTLSNLGWYLGIKPQEPEEALPLPPPSGSVEARALGAGDVGADP